MKPSKIELLKAKIAAKDVMLESLRAKRDELDKKLETIRKSIGDIHWERQELVDQLIDAQKLVLDAALAQGGE